jgi:hypothetical protein
MAEEQSCLTRVNLYISLEIFWKYRMFSIVRRGSSIRSLVMMFLYLLPDTSRSPGFLEVPITSSVDGCGAPASRNAFSPRSLRSKQLPVGGQTLTCAIRRSGISCGRTNLNYTGSSVLILSWKAVSTQAHFKRRNPMVCLVKSR